LKILLLDNFDSFTYNLFHYLVGFDCEVDVFRNDEISILKASEYDKIILSPGPGLPKNANDMPELIEKLYLTKPILGVCLGMQAIGEFFGGTLYNQKEVKHGVQEKCTQKNHSKLFKNVPLTFQVGLYHSWAVDISQVPILVEIARSEDGVLMAFEHKTLPIYGVQFHPESLMTEYGKTILANFLFRTED
jgi:anthranilate synthase component II